MSLFQKSLRSSRLVTLPPKYSLQEPSPTHPTQQVIYSPTASRVRQDYGLKAALPKKTKSKHIVLRKLDMIERMTDFDAGDHYWRVLQRFQQFKQSPGNIRPYEIVIKDKNGNISTPFEPITDLDSAERALSAIDPFKQPKLASLTPRPRDEACLKIIIDNDTNYSRSQLDRALDSIRKQRLRFRDWFNQQRDLSGRAAGKTSMGASAASPFNAVKSQPEKLERAAYDFVSGKPTSSSSFKSSRDHHHNGVQNNAGLSYLPKGMMSNTPYGATIAEPVPARFLNVGTSSYEVYGVGGFAVKAPLRRVRHPVHFREPVYNAVISSLNVNQTSGKVNIEIEPSDSLKGTVGIKTLNRTTFQPYTGPYASAATKEFAGKVTSPSDSSDASSSSSFFRNPLSSSSMFSSANLSRNQHSSSSDISRIIGILDPNNRGKDNNVNKVGDNTTSARPTFQIDPKPKNGNNE